MATQSAIKTIYQPNDENAILMENVHKWFGSFHVLKDINLTVNKGERIVICGPSGSGKSTLIRCINRLEEHQKGEIFVEGVELTSDLKNIEIIENERMVENAAETGDYMLGQFKDLQAEHPIIGDVRGIGLLQGMELVNDRDTKSKFPPELKVGERLSEKFRLQGLILGAQDNSVGVSPPLCITKHEVDELVAAVDRAFTNLEAELPTVQ